MTKSVAALTFILLACAVSAAPPSVPSTPADPGLVPAQTTSPLAPSADLETGSSQSLFSVAPIGQPEPIPQVNLCKLECRIDYVDCQEIYPALECYVSYQLCLSNC